MNSPSVTALFAEIEMDYLQMLSAANCILSIEENDDVAECNNDIAFYTQTILSHEKDFLAGMDAIVFQYDLEAQNAIDFTQRISYVLTTLSLLGIIGIWLSVFRPAIRRVQRTQDKLYQQADALAQARDEAVHAANVKSQILMNISHDARTPITSIMLYTDMVRRTHQGTLSERQIDYLDRIVQNAKQLNTFLQNLLDQAKLQTGSVRLVHEPIDFMELGDELNAVLKPLAESKDLGWELAYEPDFPTMLHGDRTRILQILTNLGNNAIKFTQKGHVAISFIRHDEQHWGFRVKDTGQGISSEAQEHIFEQFWQSDGSMTRQNQSGVGLGLAIVKSLVDLMSGRIYVNSELNQGTEFEVWIPWMSLDEAND